MSLPVPNLDDKRFEQLSEEARKLIPIYAPEWTDHNLSDPGITLLELFAWLTEMQLYSLNRVSRNHLLKYLKLLGTVPRPARPAKIDLTFGFPSTGTFQPLKIEKGARIISRSPSGEETVFETDQEIDILNLSLKKILVYSNFKYEDMTEFNRPNKNFFYAFGPEPKAGNTIYLGFDQLPAGKSLNLNLYLYERDLPLPGQHGAEALLYAMDGESYWINNGDERLPLYPPAKVEWSCWVKGTNSWQELAPTDETFCLTKDGRISFLIPENVVSDEEILEIHPNFRAEAFWIRGKLASADYEIPPRIERILLNTVSATQGETVGAEIMTCNGENESSGLPGQRFETKYRPIISGSQAFRVDANPWNEVDDFDGSGPESKHYVLDCEKGIVLFGDGISGMIPPRGSKISVSYRYGGGEKGNVGANRTNRLEGHQDIEVINNFAASGGQNPETVEEAFLRVRKDLRVPYVAVTSEDFEAVTLATPGLRVARVKGIRHQTKQNVMKVVIVPYSLSGHLKPSQGFKKTICAHLDQHRLITTGIEVADPDFVEVSVCASIKILKGYKRDSVMERCVAALNHFLSPIHRGEGESAWPFGRTVYRSEVYEVLEDVEGVDGVVKLTLSASGGSFTTVKGDIDIEDHGLVYSGAHTIDVIMPYGACTEDYS